MPKILSNREVEMIYELDVVLERLKKFYRSRINKQMVKVY